MRKLLCLATLVGLMALFDARPAFADPPDGGDNGAPAAALQGLVGECVLMCTDIPDAGSCFTGTLEKVTGKVVELFATIGSTTPATCRDLFIFKDKILYFTTVTDECPCTPE